MADAVDFAAIDEPDVEDVYVADNQIDVEHVHSHPKSVHFADQSKSRVKNVKILKSVLKVNSNFGSEDIWFVDSGTKQSLTPHAERVTCVTDAVDGLPALRTIDGSQLPATGIGTRLSGVLTNVAVCPTAADQLAAVSELHVVILVY